MSWLQHIKLKQWLIITAIASYLVVFLLPIRTSAEVRGEIQNILTIVGILFGILVGFFITELWTRFQKIRDNVAVEVSGLQTYYLYAQGFNTFPRHQEWVKKEQSLIDKYVREFFKVEWTNYEKIDPYFNEIMKSLADIKELKSNREIETFTNLLPILNDITTAREKLFMYGKDQLDAIEWIVLVSLASILIIAIVLTRIPLFSSLFLSGTLVIAISALLLLLRDLNNLSFGEQMISFEPYETIFDVLGLPRFYLKRDIKSGRIAPPKNIDYRVG